MKSPLAALALFTVLGPLGAGAVGAAAGPPGRPALTPCNGGLPPEALCGTYEVFENRAARKGRKIPLRIVVIPAAGPDRLPDPFVYFAGKPGGASILEGLSTAGRFASLHQKRDVLLIDLRGTGESGGLFCTELKGEGNVQGFLDDFLPTAKVRACRDRLMKEVDLSWYTTDAAVDDVEEVRTALGYGPLNLMGSSYGTRAVLTYLRRHPGSVRTATLAGVMAPDERYPLGLAQAAQKALDGLIAECAGDQACRGAFPKLREEVDAVLRHAAGEPARVELTDPRSGKPVEIRLSHAAVAQTLSAMLYSPAEAALLPLRVHQAAQGNWQPLARAAYLHTSELGSAAAGAYQSVTCGEDVAFIRNEEIAAAVAGTFLGDFRVRRQKAACEGWPTRELGREVHAAVVSDVPALLISGERDPATPAANGEQAGRTLKRSRHLVVADGGHVMMGMQGDGCVLGLIDAFIEAGTTEGLDTSCIAGMRRPGFELPEATLAKADLERLQGSYANPEWGFAFKVALAAGHLRLTITQGPPFPPALLVPTSPTRFRVEGEGMAAGLTVEFQVTEGKASALNLIQPGKPQVPMERTD